MEKFGTKILFLSILPIRGAFLLEVFHPAGNLVIVTQAKPHCDQCGTDRKSPLSREVKTYGKWAWFLILFGISSKPTAVHFQCAQCGQVFDRLSPEELEHYV